MEVHSSLSALEGVCKVILDLLGRYKYGDEDIFAVHLALEEAFSNAVEHGNRGDPNKTVRIDYAIDDKRVELRLTDQGNGFDPQKVPDPRLEENITEARGRGLLLIRAYMDQVEFTPKGNSVRMVRMRHPEPAPQ
ncbi:MAG: ATP-binding protein [Sedimentisphaerales bacterium]|nr:ATP-binding protein [Sedimentisphaerales bacterium]